MLSNLVSSNGVYLYFKGFTLGIEVSARKHVTINDTHQHGVNTLVAKNPTHGRKRGIKTLHVFKRNYLGGRDRDDGNPLIHALKNTGTYKILPHWRSQFDTRAQQILANCLNDIQQHDYLLPIPSSSPFCSQFTAMVAGISGVPVLNSAFLTKKTVGEVLNDTKKKPPRLKPSQESAFQSELDELGRIDPYQTYKTKLVTNNVQTLFHFFKIQGNMPAVANQRILVVDDLLATGSSLFSIREILQNQHGAQISYLSYLSDV